MPGPPGKKGFGVSLVASQYSRLVVIITASRFPLGQRSGLRCGNGTNSYFMVNPFYAADVLQSIVPPVGCHDKTSTLVLDTRGGCRCRQKKAPGSAGLPLAGSGFRHEIGSYDRGAPFYRCGIARGCFGRL